MEKILLVSHIVAGAGSLLFGIGALGLGKKGGRVHRLLGTAYFWSMAWIFASALLILLLYRFNSFLTFISIFSFYLAFSGYRVLRRKKPGSHRPIDWAGALAALAATIAVAALALVQVIGGRAGLLELLSLFFGLFSIQAALADIRVFLGRTALQPRWWLFHHIQAMIGSFIAAVTAFLVQNGSKVFADPDIQWIFWVAPTLAGVLYINFMVGRYRRESGSGPGD